MIDIDALKRDKRPQSSTLVHALIDRLEAAESEAIEQARLNGMGSEREAALMAKLEAAEKERDNANAAAVNIALEAERLQCENDTLRAKIAEMGRQEPVAWMLNCQTLGGDTGWILSWTQSGAGLCNRLQGEENEKRLYALSGARPAPSVPDTYAAGINAVAAMLQSKAAEYAKEHGHDDMGGLSFGSGMGGEIKMDYYTNLIELADDVRAMIAAAPEAKP